MPLALPSESSHRSLMKVLRKRNLISDECLERSWNFSEQFPLAEISAKGYLKEAEGIAAVAEELKVDVIDIDHQRFTQIINLLDNPALGMIDSKSWDGLRAVPVSLREKNLTVAFANPLDHESLRSLEFHTGLSIRVAIASEEHIRCCLSRKLPNIETEFRSLLQTRGKEFELTPRASNLESNLTTTDDEAPVIRLVNRILGEGVQCGASDIHLSPEREQLEIRVRIDGILRPLLAIPSSLQAAVISRLKLLSGMDIAERRKPQDGRLRIKTPLGPRDLRLSTIPTANGENLVIRILSSDLAQISFESLGLQPSQVRQLQRCLTGSSRVVLVTGPTGSGKTSTLYASLLSLKDGETNIITIEDPIEYRIGGLNQTQVNNKIGVTFAQGLRAVLRQDPDVVMVGEIRDQETAQIAFQASQTGHLVLSTLHTNSAAATIVRLRDMGVASYVIAASLGAVIAQRLVRKLCPNCSTVDSNPVLKEMASLGLREGSVRKAVGCESCKQTGYQGRTAIYSMLEINDDVRDAIREERSEGVIEQAAQDFLSLLEAGVQAVNSGITSIDEVERCLGSLELHQRNRSQGSNKNRSAQPKLDAPKGRKKVLLAEDDENIRMVLSMLLENEAYEVIATCDGTEAIKKVYETRPDIVVCDLMMPKLDGYGVVRHIRSDQELKRLPILMLTAAQTEENEIRLLDIGADDFVGKTSDPKVLISRISRLLNRSGPAAP